MMNPNQYPKGFSNAASSQLFQEICAKNKDIVSLTLFFHKNDMILPGLPTVESSTCTTNKKNQLDLRCSC